MIERVERSVRRFEEGIDVVYELSSQKMVRMGYYEGGNIFLIQIRDYLPRPSPTSPHKPEKKGIALTMAVWKSLYDNINAINADAVRLY